MYKIKHYNRSEIEKENNITQYMVNENGEIINTNFSEDYDLSYSIEFLNTYPQFRDVYLSIQKQINMMLNML